MRRRKIRDEADAKTCLAAVRAAGGDSVRWARAHGIDARSLNAWRVNLGRHGGRAATRMALVELVPAPSRVAARYVLDVDGVRLELDDSCAFETVRRIVQALRSC